MKERIIVTVMGSDKIGIVAKVTAKLEEFEMNILDISQTIFENNVFVMTVLTEVETGVQISKLADVFKALGKEIGVDIHTQHAAIFDAMHRI